MKAAVLFKDGFEELEALSVVDVLRRAQLTCLMVGMDAMSVKSSHGIEVKMDQLFDESVYDADIVVLPGGLPGATSLRDDQRVIDILKTFNEQGKWIGGENLDVTLGSIPLKDTEKDAVKANILKLLQEKYDIEEEDFLSAEIEVVPSGPARDYGLDRSMVMGYGHDDRVCAYTSLKAILDIQEIPQYTSCCILVDKEEIGSVGATGAQSLFFENTIAQILHLCGDDTFLSVRKALAHSMMLSSDVSAGFDPLYKEVNDPKNAAYLGKGIVFNKYTGSRGKSGSNDANPEYFAKIRNIMDQAGVHFQTAELGKVDQGGGGTIAYILGNYDMNVIDAGIAVLNMHAPHEIVSKVDVYEAYLAYTQFLLQL